MKNLILILALFACQAQLSANFLLGDFTPRIKTSCADMDAAWQIELQTITQSPQPTGTFITYRIQIQCSAITANSCDNSEIRIPLQSPTQFDLSLDVDEIPAVRRVYTDFSSNERVIELVEVIPAGTSIEFEMIAFAPTNTTPDGTMFTIDATIAGDNTNSDLATATGSWSAEANLGVAKYLQFGVGTDALVDQPMRYYIYPCQDDFRGADIPGRLWIENWLLTDTLPAGSVFSTAASGFTYDAATNSVNWSGNGNLPLNSCNFQGEEEYWVEVIFPTPAFGDNGIQSVTNKTTLSGYPIGAEQIPANLISDSDQVTHGFGQATPDGSFSKVSTTDYFASEDITFENDQTQFSISLLNRSTSSRPYFFRITDRLPCLNNDTDPGVGRVYESPASGTGCTDPAFQPDSLISIDLSTVVTDLGDAQTFIADNPTIPLRYVRTDGVTGLLNLPFLSINGGGRLEDIRYQLPWSDVLAELGSDFEVRELAFDSRDIDVQIIVTGENNIEAFKISLEGTVAPDTPEFPVLNNDVIRNTADFDFILGDDVSLSGETTAEVQIIDSAPGLAAVKFVTENTGRINLIGSSRGEPFRNDDTLIITDLLPAGYTFDREDTQEMRVCGGTWQWSVAGQDRNSGCEELDNISVRNYIDVEVIDDYNGTGRQLVRASFLPPPTSGVWEDLNLINFSFFVQQVPMRFATVNEMRVFPSSPESSQALLFQNSSFRVIPALSNDTDDQDGDGLITGDAFASDEEAINVASTVLEVNSVKAVRGDFPVDQPFGGFPKVGAITETGGTGDFQINISNVGGVGLRDLVVYDVLPYVGDVGLSETQVGLSRDSEFEVVFSGVDPSTVPPGAQVEYSFSNNPCRDELTTGATPFPTACVNDWTTTIPPSDTALVRGLRFTFPSGDFTVLAPGEGFSIEFGVTYPVGTTPGEVAWNTFAYGAIREDDNAEILPTEPPKVGLGVPLIDLELTKRAFPRQTYIDQPVRYTITVDHAGNVSPQGVYTGPTGTATNVVLQDDFLAQGLTIVPNSATIINRNNNSDGGATFNEGTGEINIPEIGPNDTYDIEYLAFSSTAATIFNTAEIIFHTEEDEDSVPGNGDDGEDDIDDVSVTWANPSIDLQKLVETRSGSGTYIEADATDGLTGSYLPGQPVNYRFVITNTGNIELISPIELTDNLIGGACNTNFPGLDPGEMITLDCTWPLGFQASDDPYVNVATVTANSSLGGVTQTVTDADSASVLTDIVFDLALIKVENGTGPYSPGEEISFNISVFNQGTEPVFDVDVADYFNAAELSEPVLTGMPSGVVDNDNGTFTIEEIPAGGSFSFEINTTVQLNFSGTAIINNAEITGGAIEDGGLNTSDRDSSPGNNSTDPPETATDDKITDADTGATIDDDDDEDDFDPAAIEIEQSFDLALRKRLVNPDATVTQGGTIDFLIEVFNQGTVNASGVVLSDYFPMGIELADEDWTDNGDNSATVQVGDISRGTSAAVEITLRVSDDFVGTSFSNYAEITAANNVLDFDDEDSTPGDNRGLDESATDDDIDDEFPNTPGSEDNPADNDDYDLAVVSLCNVTVDAGQPQTNCSRRPVQLAGSISPMGTGGIWTTDGDGGFFEDEAGTSPTNSFTEAAFYLPGELDSTRGNVTLSLTSEGSCPAVTETVEISINQVGSGSFFWDGRN